MKALKPDMAKTQEVRAEKKRLTNEQILELNSRDGYFSTCSRCPYCGKALYLTPFVFDESRKDYVCLECARKNLA